MDARTAEVPLFPVRALAAQLEWNGGADEVGALLRRVLAGETIADATPAERLGVLWTLSDAARTTDSGENGSDRESLRAHLHAAVTSLLLEMGFPLLAAVELTALEGPVTPRALQHPMPVTFPNAMCESAPPQPLYVEQE